MKVFYKIHQFTLSFERSVQRELQKECPEITFSQLMFLMAIDKFPNSSQRIIAETRQLTPAAISKQINLLMSKGWISRKDRIGSKREYILTLSTKGGKILSSAKKVLFAHRKRVFKEGCKRDLETIEAIIDKWFILLNNDDKNIN